MIPSLGKNMRSLGFRWDRSVESRLTTEVKVFGIVFVEHGSGYVGHIPSRITFTCQEDSEILDTIGILELLEEIDEVHCNFLFVGSNWRAVGVAHSNWLVDPRQQSDFNSMRRVLPTTHHNMFVRLTHEYGLTTGSYVPGSQVNRPFSCKNPCIELQPGPPLNHTVRSLLGSPIFGWNM